MASSRQVGDALKGFTRLVNQKRVNNYANASGDYNPIHLNESYAADTPFGTRIAHGMLSLALVSEMLMTEFPDTWHDGGSIKVRFTAPVFPGETVETYGKIVSIDNSSGRLIATCQIGCKKPNGTDAVVGRATVPLE